MTELRAELNQVIEQGKQALIENDVDEAIHSFGRAIQIANELFDIADELEKKRLYRFAEQLRGSGMSMSNNTCPVK